MSTENTPDLKQIFLIILFFTLFIVSLLVVNILIVPLLVSIILVYLLNPLYERIKRVVKFHFISSALVMLIFFSLFIIPSFFVYFELTKELHTIDFVTLETSMGKVNSAITNSLGFELELHKKTANVGDKLHLFMEGTLYKIPIFLFHIFLISFFYFYFSRDYTREKIYFKSIFKKNFVDAERNFKQLIEGIVYGQLLVRFIQAIIGTIGFLLFDVSGAIFYGFMLFFMGFLPVVGTGIIWGPLSLFYFAKQDFITAIAILAIGIFISLIDNILLPYIVSGKTNMGPVITLVSIIGGMTVFGIYGIMLGPLFVGLFMMVGENLFSEIRKRNPDSRKIIWTEKERKSYKTLQTDIDRENYIKKLNNKYKQLQVPSA